MLRVSLRWRDTDSGSGRATGRKHSLGVIFYELLAGARPFDAQTPQAIMRQHMNMKPPSLRERAPWVSESMAQLVHDMLAKDGFKRPSMAQVQERLALGERRSGRKAVQRYLLIGALAAVLGSGSWLWWRRSEHHGVDPSVRAAQPVGTSALSSTSAAAGSEAPTAPAPPSGSAAVAGTASEPTPGLAAHSPSTSAPGPAATGGPPPASGAVASGAAPASSRQSRTRGHRDATKRSPAGTSAPAPASTAGGVLKTINFGKH